MPTFSWVAPEALLLLLLLVPFFWATRLGGLPFFWARRRDPNRGEAARWKGPAVGMLRALALTAIVLAIADLRMRLPTEDLTVAVVIDDTPRLSSVERTRLSNAFFEVEHPATRTEAPAGRSLAARIAAATATLPGDQVRRLVVVSDGATPTSLEQAPNADDGELFDVLKNAARLGIDVRLLPAGDQPLADNLAVTGLEVARLLRSGESVDVSVGVFSASSRRVTLVAEIDGETAVERAVAVPAGRSRKQLEITFPTEPGVHELSVHFKERGDGGIEENDRFHRQVYVSTRPHVLIVHEPGLTTPPALLAVMKDAEFEVITRSAATFRDDLRALERFGVVILDEVNLARIPEKTQHALRRYVEDAGGGLLTVTGTHAVRSEPRVLRELEPVTRPPAIPEPRPLELMLAIDRSGSMEGQPMAQARAAAVAAIGALRSDALVGTVAFSGAADRVMPPVAVGENGDAAAGFVSQIHAGGGTSIAAALTAAGRVMSDDDRYLHHVILLSDGHSAEGPAIAAANALASRGITITAITLGDYNPLMAQIAAIGRGRYHVTQNARALPALFVREAQYRQPPAQLQRPFVPEVVTHHRMIRGIDFESGPRLLGLTLAKAKDEADVLLRGPGAGPDEQPVLAHWHRGLGQVATFTSNTSGGWANDWRRWPGFRTFFEQVAWALMKRETPEPVDLRLDPLFRTPGVARLTVSVDDFNSQEPPEVQAYPWVRREPNAQPSNSRGSDSRGSNSPPRGEPVALEMAGPGRWTATLPVGEGILVTARPLSDRNPTSAVGIDRPSPMNLRTFGADEERLARWATIAQGSVVHSVDEALSAPEPVRVQSSLRPWLFAAALLLYLASLLCLRFPEGRRAHGGRLEPAPDSEGVVNTGRNAARKGSAMAESQRIDQKGKAA